MKLDEHYEYASFELVYEARVTMILMDSLSLLLIVFFFNVIDDYKVIPIYYFNYVLFKGILSAEFNKHNSIAFPSYFSAK